MCGICGVYGFNAPVKTNTMIKSLAHRGPDGSDIKNYPWGSLGFNYLDIFGPSRISQPHISSDQDHLIIFNGEIYNYHELKRSLEPKQIIEDEVSLISALYMRDGEECFKRFKGMFAIAIMSPKRLLLIRDALGIKPLFYCKEGDNLYFASEIKALLRIKNGSIDIDENVLAEVSVFGFIFNLDKTLFKDINQVPPGSCLIYENKNIQIKKYYNLSPAFYDSKSNGKCESSLIFNNLMEDAAKKYLNHAKHSQAIYLSGGVDSSIMTYYLQKYCNGQMDTYTLYDHTENEDKAYALHISIEFKTKHNEHRTSVNECLEFLDHYLFHYESLVTDGIFNVLGSLAFHLLSKTISKKHKIAYCGEGADELFGGYYWMHTHPLGFADRLRARSVKINNGRTEIGEYINVNFPDDDLQESNFKKKIFDLLMGPGLTNCHLWSVDRSCSAFSFEARPIYLYDDIREWALSLPIEYKVSDNRETKLILKKFTSDSGIEILERISRRKKIGMPAALSGSLDNLIRHCESRFAEIPKSADLPHKQYDSYFNTDFERYLFDRFYDIFIVNRGNLSQGKN